MKYTVGSLFDGSGGFPLAGTLCGLEPLWASEVEPYPIAVTRSRFPKMKHLGDITKINGADIEPVDIITFGSPCQDLSVAGKQAGLKGVTRSGLFMEAIRIIKEMSDATNGKYPTFALWENVPGAFSSNKGEDFRLVLEELIQAIEPTASVPSVPKKGWAYADSYSGNGWSLAYRVLDAQYWGVPQRRRRIHLVLDLRGERARKVLFEREGLRGYSSQSREAWQGSPSAAQESTGADCKTFITIYKDPVGALCLNDGCGTSNQSVSTGKLILHPSSSQDSIVRRLTPTECARLQGFPDQWGSIDKKNELTKEEHLFWQEVRNTHAAINGRRVRDYTEKQMLSWFNKLQTDSTEYKMWGNGIALPTALYCMQGMAEALDEERKTTW